MICTARGLFSLIFFVITDLAQAAPSSVSAHLELESAVASANSKKEIHLELTQDWHTAESNSKIVVLSRSAQNGRPGLELLVLDRENPAKVLASPTIELREDSNHTRARLKLETGEWMNIKLNRL